MGKFFLNIFKKPEPAGNARLITAGKEDSVKETQEGCLSRAINGFFERPLFKKAAFLVSKSLFDTRKARIAALLGSPGLFPSIGVEQGGGQVAVPSVGQEGHDGLAPALRTFGDPQGRP